MSGPITPTNKTAPNKVLIAGGGGNRIGDLPAGAALNAGMMLEIYALSAGVNAVRPQSNAVNTAPWMVALDRPEFNTAFPTAYAVGDLVSIYCPVPGDELFMPLLSGQTVANGGTVQPDGTGKLKASTAVTATANVARMTCLDNPGTVASDTYIRVQVLN